MDVFREIEALEMDLVDPGTRKNVARLQELLADEFLEFGSSGMVIRKHDVLGNANFSGEADCQLSNFEFRALGDKHILVTCRSIK